MAQELTIISCQLMVLGKWGCDFCRWSTLSYRTMIWVWHRWSTNQSWIKSSMYLEFWLIYWYEVEAELNQCKADFMRRDSKTMSWPGRKYSCWVPVFDCLGVVKTLLAQGHGTWRYHLTNEDFDHFPAHLAKLLRSTIFVITCTTELKNSQIDWFKATKICS